MWRGGLGRIEAGMSDLERGGVREARIQGEDTNEGGVKGRG